LDYHVAPLFPLHVSSGERAAAGIGLEMTKEIFVVDALKVSANKVVPRQYENAIAMQPQGRWFH
jgi:hypothetical protein